MYAQNELAINPYQPPAASVNESNMVMDYELFLTFTGKKSKYYQKKWHLLQHGEIKSAGFNLAAMLYGPLWFLYRRMYLMFFFITMVMVIQGLIEFYVFNIVPINLSKPLSAGNLIGASVSIMLGFIANSLYFKHAQRTIIKYADDDLNKSEIKKKLVKRKPTDWLSPLSFTVLLVLLVYASIILL